MVNKEDREMYLKSFEQMRALARKEGKNLKCISHGGKVISPDSHELDDAVTLGMYSRCSWVTVDEEE